MPGCCNPPLISASRTNRERWSSESALSGQDLLQRDLAAQLLVAGQVDLAQPPSCGTAGPGTARPRKGHGAGHERRGRRGVGTVRTHKREAGLEVAVAQPLQPGARRAQRAEVGQAPLWIISMEPEVLGGERLEQEAAGPIESPSSTRIWPGTGTCRPARREGRQQRVAVDEAVLQRQQTEEQVPSGTAARVLRLRKAHVGHDSRSNPRLLGMRIDSILWAATRAGQGA